MPVTPSLWQAILPPSLTTRTLGGCTQINTWQRPRGRGPWPSVGNSIHLFLPDPNKYHLIHVCHPPPEGTAALALCPSLLSTCPSHPPFCFNETTYSIAPLTREACCIDSKVVKRTWHFSKYRRERKRTYSSLISRTWPREPSLLCI